MTFFSDFIQQQNAFKMNLGKRFQRKKRSREKNQRKKYQNTTFFGIKKFRLKGKVFQALLLHENVIRKLKTSKSVQKCFGFWCLTEKVIIISKKIAQHNIGIYEHEKTKNRHDKIQKKSKILYEEW